MTTLKPLPGLDGEPEGSKFVYQESGLAQFSDLKENWNSTIARIIDAFCREHPSPRRGRAAERRLGSFPTRSGTKSRQDASRRRTDRAAGR